MSKQLPLELRKHFPDVSRKISQSRFDKKIMALTYDEMLLIYCTMRDIAYSIKIDKLQNELDIVTHGAQRPMGTYNNPHLKALEAQIRSENQKRDWVCQWICQLSPSVGDSIDLREFIKNKGKK